MYHWITNYNYDFALASIPIQLIILIYYGVRRNLPIRSSYSFISIMVCNLVMTVADIISCEMNEVWTQFPLWIMYLINMAYFLAFVLRGWTMFDYTAEACHYDRILPTYLKKLAVIPAAIMSLLILSTPWTATIFHFAEGKGYYNCGLYPGIYYNTYFYIAVSLICIYLCRDQIAPALKVSMYGYNVILIAGILMRSMFIDTLVSSYFSILAILMIYMSVRNPELSKNQKVGTFNTNAFEEVIAEMIHRKKPFHLIVVATRNYETAKAVYGHAQVNASLRLIGSWLQVTYPGVYTFYCGNGNFVLFCDERYSIDQDAMAREISHRFESVWKNSETEVSLDAGTLVIPEELMPETAEEVISLVQYTLENSVNFTTSQTGREYTRISEANIAKMKRKQDVLNALDSALKERRMEVYFEPIYSTEQKRIVGAEALARLRDPKLGFIPPIEFVTAAEQNGDIMELGRQIFEKVCLFIKNNDLEKHGIEFINMNLSPAQCMNEQLAAELIQMAQQHQIPLSMIDLEITESSTGDLETIRQQMMTLERHGVTFSLDDFGAGRSNITRLLSLPLHVIKLDMEVVWSFFDEKSGLLPDLITMFRNANMKIVAEGVETEEMFHILAALGCHYEQGYYFSKAIPAKEFLEFVDDYNERKDNETDQ